MKTMKYIALMVLAMMIVATISFAETGRLGESRITFSPSKKLFKTADYTMTTSDTGAQAEITASSVNITITLPSVASALASGGGVQYKLIKKDATTYKVILTPASGDTIGGESARYLIGDESYAVISAGPGKDWTVEYESPYLVEDHGAGTYTTGIGSGGLFSTVTASATLTASSCGNIISMSTGTLTMVLPATVANCKITFINASTSGYAQTIDLNASDKFMGSTHSASTFVNFPGTDGNYALNVTSTSKKGDSITVVGDGVDGWYIVGNVGIWASE